MHLYIPLEAIEHLLLRQLNLSNQLSSTKEAKINPNDVAFRLPRVSNLIKLNNTKKKIKQKLKTQRKIENILTSFSKDFSLKELKSAIFDSLKEREAVRFNIFLSSKNSSRALH